MGDSTPSLGSRLLLATCRQKSSSFLVLIASLRFSHCCAAAEIPALVLRAPSPLLPVAVRVVHSTYVDDQTGPTSRSFWLSQSVIYTEYAQRGQGSDLCFDVTNLRQHCYPRSSTRRRNPPCVTAARSRGSLQRNPVKPRIAPCVTWWSSTIICASSATCLNAKPIEI